MEIPVRYGLGLGLIVAASGFVLAMTGLHTNLAAPMGFVITATIINIVIVVLALQRTAPDSNWGRQVLNGLVLGAVAAVLIFVGSWVMTTVVFPNYYTEYLAARSGVAAEAGADVGNIIAALPDPETLETSGLAVSSALSGAVGTIITSVVVAGISGFFNRAGKS